MLLYAVGKEALFAVRRSAYCCANEVSPVMIPGFRLAIRFGFLLVALMATGAAGAYPLIGPPVLRVALSKPIYHIAVDAHTGRPQMPTDVTATADVAQWPIGAPMPKEFVWHVLLDWDFKPFPTHHTINNKLFSHASPYTINFGDQIRGGTVTVFARTTLNGQTIWSKAQAIIVGDNPPKQAILRAFPRSRFGLIASKVGMAESGLHQFDTVTGMPMLSRTNDVGMMQLNAPTGSISSEDQVWDWRANLRQGLAVFAAKQRTTVLASRHALTSARPAAALNIANLETLGYLNFLRGFLGMTLLTPPIVPPLSTAKGSGILPDDPDVDHLQLSQVERDAIRRYNGGSEYAYIVALHPTLPQLQEANWQPDPTRGGVRARSGDPDYVRHVLMAHSGLNIDPPKPAKSTHGKSARRHRHRRHKA